MTKQEYINELKRGLRVYPVAFQNDILEEKISDINRPKQIAAEIPPAVAERPPVKIPRKPSLSMASFTPLARL